MKEWEWAPEDGKAGQIRQLDENGKAVWTDPPAVPLALSEDEILAIVRREISMARDAE